MRPLFVIALALPITFALTATAGVRPAAAESVRLDYRADTSCIDSARFADEVSAKLGFVPWSDDAASRIRVRIERDGRSFTGTLRGVDGAVKAVDGATCAEVTAALVTTAATSLDAGAAAPAPVTAQLGGVPVTFVADHGRVDVLVRTGGAVAAASNGVTAAAVYFDDLCTTPCRAAFAPGRLHLRFTEGDSIADGDYLIDGPTTQSLRHRSRRSTRVKLWLGGAALIAGSFAAFKFGGDSAVPIVAGSLGLSIGAGMLFLPFYVKDTFTVTQSP
jgi:hypothetical protein